MITVKAYADLSKYIGSSKSKFTTAYDNKGQEVAVGDIVKYYGIPENKIAIILVNGKAADSSTLLSDGDTLVLFSPVGGG